MSKKYSAFFVLQLMKKSCDLALEYAKDVNFEFPESTQRDADALIKRIEEIGEKANSKELANLKLKYEDIPWQNIVDTRHILVDGYEVSVDWTLVQEMCDIHIPFLRDKINLILETEFPQA